MPCGAKISRLKRSSVHLLSVGLVSQEFLGSDVQERTALSGSGKTVHLRNVAFLSQLITRVGAQHRYYLPSGISETVRSGSKRFGWCAERELSSAGDSGLHSAAFDRFDSTI